MKKSLSVVVLAAFAVWTAHADNTDQTSTTTTAAPAAAAAPAGAPDKAASNQVSTSVSATESPWGGKYLGEIHQGFDKENSKLVLDNYFYVTYKHNKNLKSTVRLLFSNEFRAREEGAKKPTNGFVPGQHMYELSHAELFNVAGFKGSGYVRAYLPTSEAALSKDRQVIGIRPRLNIVRELGPVDLGVWDQLHTYYRRDFVYGGKQINNYLTFEAGVKFFNALRLYSQNALNTVVNTEGNAFNNYFNEIGLEWDINKTFSVAAYVDNEVALDQLGTAFQKGTTEGFFDLTASF